MGTTQAFRVALHVPFSDPSAGQVVTVVAPAGDQYPSAWMDSGGGSSVPVAPGADYVLVSGPGPTYVWTAVATIDCGVY
jgi:hypothetical protein